MPISSKLALCVALGGVVFSIRLATAQQSRPEEQSGPDRIAELQQRIAALEQQIQNGGSTGNEVQAIAEIARLTMENYESKFDLIKAGLGMAAGLLALVLAGLGLLGYKGVREEVRRVLIPLEEQHAELKQRVQEEQEKFRTLTQHLEGTIDTEKNVQGLMYTVAAYVDLSDATDDARLRQALAYVKKVIETIRPPDPKILAWALDIQGYLLRRLRAGVHAALESVERSISLDPDNPRALYNGACYAALAGWREKWTIWLGRAVALDPEFRQLAAEDADFEGVRDDPAFKKLTGEPGIEPL